MLHPHKWWAMAALTVLAALEEIIPVGQQPVSLPPHPPTPVTHVLTSAQEQRPALARAEDGSFVLDTGERAGHGNDIGIPNVMMPHLVQALKMAAPNLENTDDALDINDAAGETVKLKLREEGKSPGGRSSAGMA